MTTTVQLNLMAIGRSARKIELACGELEGVMNQLLAGKNELRRHGLRLQQVLSTIQDELQNITYAILQEDAPPDSAERLRIGLKVQEAINEINQI
jgi:hypothetical protein